MNSKSYIEKHLRTVKGCFARFSSLLRRPTQRPRRVATAVCLAALGVATLGSLAGCGGDDFENRHFQSVRVTGLSGVYDVYMRPVSTNCVSFSAEPMDYRLSVTLAGNSLFIDVANLSTVTSRPDDLIIDLPPLNGILFNDSAFNASAQGTYFDPFSRYSGNMGWVVSGFFDRDEIHAISDTNFYDPGLGAFCTVSHDLDGARL